MKKIDYTKGAQILANVGVIAGIMFLGFELKQNNELLDIQIRTTTLEQRLDGVRLLFENPDAIALLDKDQTTLSDTELDRLRLMGIHTLVGMEHNYHEATLGLQDMDDLARRFRSLVHRERLNYGVLAGWRVYKGTAEPDFVIWFEQNVIELQ